MLSKITIQDALKKQNIHFIDVRAPIEFEEDHLPQAINVPILNNQEREIVGTIYKQVSQEKAIDIGLGFYRNKIPTIITTVEPFKEKTLVVYCWRGGLRSKTIAALLESEGYTVFQLDGGYKSYRAHIKNKLDTYTLKPKLIVLYGLTCTGKTALLQHFSNSIDLESFAGHRGSMYGAIGIKKRTQKMFENLLFQKLEILQQEKYIFVEGESRRVGDIFLPAFLWTAMQNGIKIKVERSMDKRVAAAVAEYCDTTEKVEQMRNITVNIRQKMNNKTKQQILVSLDKKDYATAWKLLFTEYYDPLYNHTLNRLSYAGTIKTDEQATAIAQFQALLQQLSSQNQ